MSDQCSNLKSPKKIVNLQARFEKWNFSDIQILREINFSDFKI